jgi:hypothetical protein
VLSDIENGYPSFPLSLILTVDLGERFLESDVIAVGWWGMTGGIPYPLGCSGLRASDAGTVVAFFEKGSGGRGGSGAPRGAWVVACGVDLLLGVVPRVGVFSWLCEMTGFEGFLSGTGLTSLLRLVSLTVAGVLGGVNQVLHKRSCLALRWPALWIGWPGCPSRDRAVVVLALDYAKYACW